MKKIFKFFKKAYGNFGRNNQNVITRIAPSPTGVLHIGTVRTALFNYLYAKKHRGKFVLRIEDTDKERSEKKFEEDIIEGLKWLGLDFDEMYRQSERTDIYSGELSKMLANGSAYISKETEGDRAEVIRYKNPNKVISFEDTLRGEISFDTTELGDFVIAKSITEPLYHLAVVIDDALMGITRVIRGDDGISNTPRQILIQQGLGYKRPSYTHLPMILGKDKSKLSKRHGATAIFEYKEKGYLKEAIINYVAFLGWNPGTDKEIFSKDEPVSEFDLEKISKSGAVFDEEKLRWYNREYLKRVEDEEYLLKARSTFNQGGTSNLSDDYLLKLKEIIMERIHVWSDIDEMSRAGEFDYFMHEPVLDAKLIVWKKADPEKTKIHLNHVLEAAKNINPKDFSRTKIREIIWEYCESAGRGEVLWPLRYALSGKEKSPEPFTIAEIIGKEKTLNRIQEAIKML